MKASRDSSGKMTRGGSNADPACVYVQNIPIGWGHDQLRQHFHSFGAIVQCDAPPSLTAPNANRGYGFVTYGSAEEAKMAQLAMNGFQVSDENGQTRTIQVAVRGQASPGQAQSM